MFWTTTAYAMGGVPAGGDAAGGFGAFVPLILMFAVFYFLLIRPQQKRAKEHKAMISALKRGDEVVTGGGIYGRVLETAEDHLILDLGDSKIKIARSAVSAVVGRSAAPAEKKAKKADDKREEKNSQETPPADE